MTFDALGGHPIAALNSTSAAAPVVAVLGPLVGYGEQGERANKHVRFWAHETPRVYWAKESDTQMLGTVDIDPYEKVWREIDWRDVLAGASIQSVLLLPEAGLSVQAQELDGTVTRFLVYGSPSITYADLFVGITVDDGSKRGRRLRYRVKEL